MKIYIVLEHPESMGSIPNDLGDTVHGVFLDQRRAEDFVQGMIRYISTYEGRRLFFEGGRAIDAEGTTHLQIIGCDSYG